MKFYHISLLLFFVYVLAGCIDEDLDYCPEITENNLILKFVHTDGAGADIFPGNIHRTEVFVFDVNGYFVQHQSVEKEALSVFAGTELNLAAGTYRIVCWGNAYDKTTLDNLSAGSLFSDAFAGFGIPDASGIATGGDPLYYAPRALSPSQSFIVTVPEQGVETAVVDFCSAHIKIEIYIKGFGDISDQGEPLLPLVELTDLSAGYDFDMQASAPVIS
ncbi:FimB/Mfa2 family fimbrial subunit, partial [Dysgonomonas reticulitermitis]